MLGLIYRLFWPATWVLCNANSSKEHKQGNSQDCECVGGLIPASAASFNTRGYFMLNGFVLLFSNLRCLSLWRPGLVLILTKATRHNLSCCDHFRPYIRRKTRMTSSYCCCIFFLVVSFHFVLQWVFFFLFFCKATALRAPPLCTPSNGVVYNHACLLQDLNAL